MLALGSGISIPIHVRYGTHALQSCVDHAAREATVALLLKLARDVITLFHTTKGKAALHQAQASNATSRRMLILPGDAHWDSEYDAIHRMFEEWKSIGMALIQLKEPKLIERLEGTKEKFECLYVEFARV